MNLLFICTLLAASIAAAPSPAKYSTTIRKNWDKKGISYPGQRKTNSEAPSSSLAQTLISAPFRKSLDQAAWSRTQKVNDWVGSHKQEHLDTLQRPHIDMAGSTSQRTKRPRPADWQSAYIQKNFSSSDPDLDRRMSNEGRQRFGHPAASGGSSADGHSDTEASSLLSDEYQSSVPEKKKARSSMQPSRTYAEHRESIERHRKLFAKVWKEPRFSLGQPPLELAKTVRAAKDHGMRDVAFRKMAASYVRSNANPQYAARYDYHAVTMRRNENLKKRKPHLPPKNISPDQLLITPGARKDSIWGRKRKQRLIDQQVEKAVLKHLKGKRLDYRKISLLGLEIATRDFPSNVIDGCSDKKVTYRINEVFRKWKSPTVVEWHEFTANRKKYRDNKNRLAKEERERKG